MKKKILITLVATVLNGVVLCDAQSYIIEPDNYTDYTVLDHVSPPVNLITTLSDNHPVDIFHITASFDGFGYASTGTNVFGHVGIPFFNSDRRLRMDFAAPVSAISIDFIGGEYFATEVGQLDAYSGAGQLLASYVTLPRGGGSVETMSVFRPAGDIAWAVAYVPPSMGSFGRLDNLRFTVVPEPSTGAVLACAAACIGLWRRAGRRGAAAVVQERA